MRRSPDPHHFHCSTTTAFPVAGRWKNNRKDRKLVYICTTASRRRRLCHCSILPYQIPLCVLVGLLCTALLLLGRSLVRRHDDSDALRSFHTNKTEFLRSDHTFRKNASQGLSRPNEPSEAISPFTSIPPKAIDRLDPANNPRHSCLSKMRQRHDDALRSYLQTPDHILLVDPAYHSNVGDHMITLGELQFLKPYLSQRNIQLSQCSYIQAGKFVPPCVTEIPRIAKLYNRPLAIWHGGGNWGDLWRRAQEPRIQSLENLLGCGYMVVTMPNSWYYKNKSLELQDIEQIRIKVEQGRLSSNNNSAGSLVFCWREEFSFEQGQLLLPFATNLLVPDIAFQLGPYLPIRPSNAQMVDIVLLLRDDHESVVQQRSRAGVRAILNASPNGLAVSFSIVDWHDRLVRFNSEDFFFTDTAIQLLSMGRVVICDRLHAAILAYLMGVPFIYLDQVSGKITKTLTASMSTCNVDITSRWDSAMNISEALTKATEWLTQLNVPELSRAAKRERLQREMHFS